MKTERDYNIDEHVLTTTLDVFDKVLAEMTHRYGNHMSYDQRTSLAATLTAGAATAVAVEGLRSAYRDHNRD